MLCLLYLGLVLMQLFIFSTNEITYFYKVLKQQLRLVCYEITFRNKQTQTTPAELRTPGDEDQQHRMGTSRLSNRPSRHSSFASRGHWRSSGLFNMQSGSQTQQTEANQIINQ